MYPSNIFTGVIFMPLFTKITDFRRASNCLIISPHKSYNYRQHCIVNLNYVNIIWIITLFSLQLIDVDFPQILILRLRKVQTDKKLRTPPHTAVIQYYSDWVSVTEAVIHQYVFLPAYFLNVDDKCSGIIVFFFLWLGQFNEEREWEIETHIHIFLHAYIQSHSFSNY